MSVGAATLEYAREEMRNEIALTPRWTPLRPHPIQSLMVYHPARFHWCPSGRRSGKTELVKRDAVSQLLIDREQPARLGIGAPTFTRAKDIYFEDLKELIPPHWIKTIKESTSLMEFRTHWNATIRLFGMNNPKVVEGPAWDKLYCDEMADYPPKCFQTHIRPALATPGRKGSGWFVGVPDEVGPNQAEYEHFWLLGLRWPEDRDHCSFWWKSADVGDPEELEAIAAGTDSDLYAQEMEGRFIRSGGKAFSKFSHLNVSSHYAEYSPFLPIVHSLDFGVRPACSLIGQHYKNSLWIVDEIVLDDGDTDSAAIAFLERCNALGITMMNGLQVYGDASGRTPGQNTGESDYQILRQVYRSYRPEFKNPLGNPEVKDTINAVRGAIRDYRGRVSLFIHPRCSKLIEELKSAPWPSKLREWHLTAALRYYVYGVYGRSSAGITGISSVGVPSTTENQRVSARYTR